MEDQQQTNPSYWNSVIIAALITAIVVTIFSLIGGYMTIGTEPSGSFFSSAQLFSTLGCLIGALGGLYANWHYTKAYDVNYKIGKGALIGLLVGAVATVFSLLLGEIWGFIDPGFEEAIIDWNIQNMEAMQMPAEAKEQAIAGLEEGTSVFMEALYTFIGLGIVNVISGLIGAKVFASEE